MIYYLILSDTLGWLRSGASPVLIEGHNWDPDPGAVFVNRQRVSTRLL